MQIHPAVATFKTMTAEQQRAVHVLLLEQALSVWEQYYPPGGSSTYQETVTGTMQELDVGLPREALASLRQKSDLANVAARYREPIVALQDADLVLPRPAEFAYYAIYNDFRLHVLGHNIDPWLVVNQALSTLEQEQVVNVLQDAVNNVGEVGNDAPMAEMPSCFRGMGIELRRLPESSTGVEFLECPSCRRHYARKPAGPLTYRWLHPLTLALYGVIFDEDPVPQAAPQAEAFSRGRPPDELRSIVEEIELELNEPTHHVRDALENRAAEEKCREYLREFVAHIRAHT